VNILNPEHLLKPGMNTEVEIHVGQRQGVLAVPNAALRTERDVASAATVLGLDPQAVQRQLNAAPGGGAAPGGSDGSKLHAAEPAKADGQVQSSAATGPSYIVFALRGGKIVPIRITTGLTDLDYIEVTSGLAETDTVLVLSGSPSR